MSTPAPTLALTHVIAHSPRLVSLPMLHLSLRNLFQSKSRLLISAGGVALALSLILLLDAILAGSERQLTAYVERSGADVFVSQQGVRTLHMATSSLPMDTLWSVTKVPGVRSATPIQYVTANVALGAEQALVYVIGLPPSPAAGAPWRIIDGAPLPGPGQVVVDQEIATRAGVRLGDRASILGREFTIAGLAGGTVNLTNSIAFISFDDFTQLRGGAESLSYVLVRTAPGETPTAIAQRIEAAVPGVTAQSRDQFAVQERQIVRDMSTDIMAIMNGVGFSIGLAVMALTIYTATLARRREYGVLKAIGATNRRLYAAVLAQAYASGALGLGLALLLVWIVGAALPRFAASLALDVTGSSVLKVAAAAVLIAALAALLPARRVAALDPAMVYRGS